MTAPAPSPAASPRPQMPPLRVAVELFSESAAHRAELAALELEEAREHVAGSSLLAGIAAALTLFAGFAFTLLVASLVWELPSRGWWLGALCSLYVAAAVTAGFLLAKRLRDWRPLGETQTQLQQDYQCLSQLIKSNAP